MKLGYSSYAMRELDVFEALPRLQSIGYQAMEICTRDGWQTAPDRFGDSDRDRLGELLQDLGFPPPPLMDGLSLGAEGSARKAMFERATATFKMANDLNFGSGPAIVTTTEGESHLSWDDGRERIRDSFVELADVAAIHNVMIAAEPHFGMVLDTPEKAVWLMEQTNHPNLRLNFDISHFVAQGFDLRHSVNLCVPHAVHTHVKDGYVLDGKVQYQLPGDGNLDLIEYFRAVAGAGLSVPIYVEVSRMLSELSDYDPWRTAQNCFKALATARTEALGTTREESPPA